MINNYHGVYKNSTTQCDKYLKDKKLLVPGHDFKKCRSIVY
jgi:hypothetical protein